MSETMAQAAALVAMLVLPLSALAARRVRLRTALFYSAIWAIVAVILFAAVALFT